MEEEIEKLKIEISERIKNLKQKIEVLEGKIEEEGKKIKKSSLEIKGRKVQICNLQEEIRQIEDRNEISKIKEMGEIKALFYKSLSKKYKKSKKEIDEMNIEIFNIETDIRWIKDDRNDQEGVVDCICVEEEDIIEEIRGLQKKLADLDNDDKKMKVLRAMKPELFRDNRSNSITQEESGKTGEER